MKNLVLAFLTLSCGVLLYLYFTQDKNACAEPAMPAKLDAQSLIEMAEIEGISLSTPVEGVDALLESAGFTCVKQDNKTVTTDGSNHAIDWRCEHKDSAKTRISLSAKGGRLVAINRNGLTGVVQAEAVVEQVEDLKSRLQTRQGMSFSQTAVKTLFNLTGGSDAGSPRLQYKVQLPSQKPDQAAAEQSVLYRAIVTR